jgi:adenylate cyclase class 2
MKFVASNLVDVRASLLSIGAEIVGSVQQRDEYFAHPCRDFVDTDEALRIRTIDHVQILTYKGPKTAGQAKIRDELEVPVHDSATQNALREILVRLGFSPVITVSKQRQSLHVVRNGRELHIELDEVDRLGTFVEIEAICERDDIVSAEQAVMVLAKEIQLTTPTKSSYLALLLALQSD